MLEGQFIWLWPKLFAVVSIVKTEIPRVQHIVFNRALVPSHALDMVRSNKPVLFVFVWRPLLRWLLLVARGQATFEVLVVIVNWQVEVVRGCDVVVGQLFVCLDHSESLFGVELLAIWTHEKLSGLVFFWRLVKSSFVRVLLLKWK